MTSCKILPLHTHAIMTRVCDGDPALEGKSIMVQTGIDLDLHTCGRNTTEAFRLQPRSTVGDHRALVRRLLIDKRLPRHPKTDELGYAEKFDVDKRYSLQP